MICTVSKRNFGDIVKPCRFGLAVSMVVTTCLPPVLNFSLHYFTRGHFSSDIDLTYSPLLAILADYRLYFLLLKLHLFDILLTEKRSACFVADAPFEVTVIHFCTGFRSWHIPSASSRSFSRQARAEKNFFCR